MTSVSRPHAWSSPTATTFEGVAGRLPARGRGRDRRGRVQHRAVGLPGDRHRPVVRGPDHHVHLPAHRQLRRQRRRRRGARAALPRRHRARPRAALVELARNRRPRRVPAAPPRRGRSPGSTRAGSRATSAAPARCPARSASPIRDVLLAAAQADGGTDGQDLATRRHHAGGLHRRAPTTRAYFVVAYDFGIKRSILDQLVARRLPGRGRARVDARPPTCSAANPTACSSPTVPATRRPSTARSESVRGLLGNVPVFGICLGHQIMGLGARRPNLQAAVRSPRRQPSGAPPRDRVASRSRARTTTTRVDADSLPDGAWCRTST